ncbi:MAG TPA: OmpH family outer membrane protein [Pyrinomonadaceae bacterium]|nr:OmpH family outer membrane protein [Pyrinomonadaceae bacterium]
MKVNHLVAAAFVAAVASSPLLAQTRPAAQSAPPATAQANVPATKVALINTEAFADEKQGIVRIVAAVKRVDTEFQARKTELQQLQQRVQTLTDEISKIQAAPASVGVDQKSLQAKVDSLDVLKKEGTRKQEDAQAAYNKRMQEVLAPIYDDIGKSLDAFGKAQGITLLLDASKIAPAILSAADATDVTRAFIADFNSKYPATAAVAPPK